MALQRLHNSYMDIIIGIDSDDLLWCKVNMNMFASDITSVI